MGAALKLMPGAGGLPKTFNPLETREVKQMPIGSMGYVNERSIPKRPDASLTSEKAPSRKKNCAKRS